MTSYVGIRAAWSSGRAPSVAHWPRRTIPGMALASAVSEVPARDRPDFAHASIWHAPLVPVALAVTAGIIADRAVGVPASAAVVLLAIGLIGWAAGARRSTSAGLPFL